LWVVVCRWWFMGVDFWEGIVKSKLCGKAGKSHEWGVD